MNVFLDRIRQELSADFSAAKPMQFASYPGRLDVMGGVAEVTGSATVAMATEIEAFAAYQVREDDQIQIFSFDQFDLHRPFTVRIPLDAIAKHSRESLLAELNESGRAWSKPVMEALLDLPAFQHGFSLAIRNPIQQSVGLSSATAIGKAASLAVLGVSHTPIKYFLNTGEALTLPPGVRVVGINSTISDPERDHRITKNLAASSEGFRLITRQLETMAKAAGKTLIDDPFRGLLANVDAEDYKRIFRPHIPTDSLVQHALDHHILEARRVKKFVEFLNIARAADGSERKKHLDMAGHLMYASHLSYSNDAMLGDDRCDWLVKMVREHEQEGLYGARVTAGGCGGTVAVLMNDDERAMQAMNKIVVKFEQEFGLKAQLIV